MNIEVFARSIDENEDIGTGTAVNTYDGIISQYNAQKDSGKDVIRVLYMAVEENSIELEKDGHTVKTPPGTLFMRTMYFDRNGEEIQHQQ